MAWRFSEKRKLAALQEFSDTELDSGWQSLYAMSYLKDPKAKAALFQHSLEEFYHADMFAGLLSSYANAPLNRPVFTREAILKNGEDKNEVLDFLAHLHVGEKKINGDFLVYANTPVDENIRALFQRIKKDEEGHEDASWKLMVEYSDGNSKKVNWLVFKKFWVLGYQRYVQNSQKLGKFMLGIVLTGIYFVFVPFFFLPLKSRLTMDKKNQLAILKDQILALRKKS